MASTLRFVRPSTLPICQTPLASPSRAHSLKLASDSMTLLEQQLQNRISRFRPLMSQNPNAAIAVLNIADWVLRAYGV